MVYVETAEDGDVVSQRYLSHLIHQYARAAKSQGADVTPKWSRDPYVAGTVLTNALGEEFTFTIGQPSFADDVYYSCVDDKTIMMHAVKDHFNVPAYSIHKKKHQPLDEVIHSAMDIIEDQNNVITYPLIVKPNRGSRSNHVYIVHDENDLRVAIEANHSDQRHGRDIIIQQCIEDAVDVRLIMMGGECVYAKTTERFDQITTNVAFEQLHDVTITDASLLKRLNNASSYLLHEKGLEYGGIDFRLDKDDKLWFIECNSGPMGIDRIPDEPRERLLGMIFDRVRAGSAVSRQYKHAQYRLAAHAKSAYKAGIGLE